MKYALDVSAVRSIFAYRSDYFPTLQNFSSAWLVSTPIPLQWRNESLKLDFVDFVEKCSPMLLTGKKNDSGIPSISNVLL